MKEFITTLLIILFITNSPEETLVNYLNAMRELNQSEIYTLISTESKNGLTLEEYLTKNNDTPTIASSLFSRMEYQIHEIIEDEKSAYGVITMSLPDLINMPKVSNELLPLFMPPMDKEQILKINIDSILNVHYPNKDYPIESRTDTIHLTIENNQWKINRNK